MGRISILALAALGAGLAGCASAPLNAEQCAAIDWYQLGLADGRQGQALTALNDEITQCRPFDISPDMTAYNRGRDEGLQSYCRPPVLLEATVQSVGDPFVCEPFTSDQTEAFELGRDTREAVVRWQSVQQQYQQIADSLEQVNAEGTRLTQQYQQTSDEELRQQIAARLNYLAGQRDALQDQLSQAEPVMRQEQGLYEGAVQRYEAFQSRFSD